MAHGTMGVESPMHELEISGHNATNDTREE